MRKMLSLLSLSTLIACPITRANVNEDHDHEFLQALCYVEASPKAKTATGAEYYNQLMYALRHLPDNDKNAIGEAFKARVRANDQVARNAAHMVTKAIILMYAEREARQVATAFFRDRDIIEKNITSQRQNIRALFQKSDSIDSEALANYFGNNLFNRLEKVAHHPEYERYLKSEWRSNVAALPAYYKPQPQQLTPQQKIDYGVAHQEVYDRCKALLKKANMSDEHIEIYKQLFWHKISGCQNCATYTDLIRCSKQKIGEILLNDLARNEEECFASNKTEKPSTIKRAIEEIEHNIKRDISDSKETLDVQSISKYVGKSLRDLVVDTIVKHS